ncbi:MAG TPA: TRAP transporter substrate-binding protein [Aliidongia sp.]|nr:TRAP transporter substrate-binding protein [Aliidongia sp.]
MRRRDFLAGSGAAAALLTTRNGHATVRSQVLRLGFVYTRNSQMGTGAAEFGRLVEQNCGGRVRVELYPSGSAGGELEMVQDISAGTLDMSFTSSAVFSTISPDLSIFDIPFLFRDVAHARAVLDSDIGKTALAKMAPKGIVGLAWGENGLRHITTASKPVRTPADLKGMKIRVPQSEVMVAGFKAFGADAQSLGFPDLYPALASGTFQAQENPVAVIASANFDKVQRYLCLTGHVYSPAALLISKRAFDRLTPEDQQAVRAAAIVGGNASRDFADRSDKSGIDELRRRGMTIIEDVDRPAFVAALSGVEGDFEKKFGKENIDAIRAFGK